MNTALRVKELKDADQDFEWYPTTQEIIDKVVNDLSNYRDVPDSVLDCGAGDGRVLMQLPARNRYAIEKAKPHLEALDKEIYVVGTDFHQQTLIDKKVDVVFCNPPYSEFDLWATKIVSEANASVAYLVVPERWQKSDSIKAALSKRSANTKVLGSFDFLGADRSARAKVEIVKVSFERNDRRFYGPSVDAFGVWFDSNFELQKADHSELEDNLDSRVEAEQSNELVDGRDLVTTLDRLYQRDLQVMMTTYRQLGTIDGNLLKEMSVDMASVRSALASKIKGLKHIYWNELFGAFDKITSKLTSRSRQQMLDKLTSSTSVDFSAQNAYAVVIWVVKNANSYFDDQLIDTFEKMVEEANVVLYKSNKKTFGSDSWKWGRTPDGLDNFALENRVVFSRCGGISTSEWAYERERYNGLVERAKLFIDDLLVVASNLGFDIEYGLRAMSFEWVSGKKNSFYATDIRSGKRVQLVEVKAFKNGNMHMKFNQSFIGRMNVEFGRLKGWVRSPAEAVKEMDITPSDALGMFGSNLKVGVDSLPLLGFSGD